VLIKAAVRLHRCLPLSAQLLSNTLQALLRGSLRKAFGAFDLLCLGLGVVIGTGWAQLTGTAAQQYAG
jgi:hypothetical protein